MTCHTKMYDTSYWFHIGLSLYTSTSIELCKTVLCVQLKDHLLFFSTDIDECDQVGHNCDKNATCNNTIGSFECICDDGFTGNGTNCDGKSLNTSRQTNNCQCTDCHINNVVGCCEKFYIHVYRSDLFLCSNN